MTNYQLITFVVAGIFLVLYLMRRRSRLRKED